MGFVVAIMNSLAEATMDVISSDPARIDGLSDEVFTEGDFTDRTRYDEPDLYALHVLPLTLSSASYRVTDDSSPTITYTGSWSASSPIYNGTAAQDDYFDGTYHQASTAGSPVSLLRRPGSRQARSRSPSPAAGIRPRPGPTRTSTRS
jgi:hypothetical protein